MLSEAEPTKGAAADAQPIRSLHDVRADIAVFLVGVDQPHDFVLEVLQSGEFSGQLDLSLRECDFIGHD